MGETGCDIWGKGGLSCFLFAFGFFWLFFELNFGHMAGVGVRHLGRDRKKMSFVALASVNVAHQHIHIGRSAALGEADDLRGGGMS